MSQFRLMYEVNLLWGMESVRWQKFISQRQHERWSDFGGLGGNLAEQTSTFISSALWYQEIRIYLKVGSVLYVCIFIWLFGTLFYIYIYIILYEILRKVFSEIFSYITLKIAKADTMFSWQTIECGFKYHYLLP